MTVTRGRNHLFNIGIAALLWLVIGVAVKF
jgi:hypothetical protein